MKTTAIALFCIISLFASICFAEDVDPIYGTRLIPDSYDREQYKPDGELPANWANNPEWRIYHDMKYIGGGESLWSPDGNWIAIELGGGIAIMSSDGGDPRHLYDSYEVYDGYYLTRSIAAMSCFSPDSKEVYFERRMINESRGSVVQLKINEDGIMHGHSVSNVIIPTIFAVNIETGAVRTVATDAECARFSHDGRYFAYRVDIKPKYAGPDEGHDNEIAVVNLATGQKHYLNARTRHFQFSHDDSYILYEGTCSLHRIPVSGGISEEIPVQIEGSGSFRDFKTHPDGEWIMYRGGGGPRSRYWIDENGYKLGYSSSDIDKLFTYNLVTGESLALFPVPPPVNLSWATFSPDGSEIIYYYRNSEGQIEDNGMFRTDFDTSVAMKYSGAVSVETIVPEDFALNTPYPNPFNPTTTIEFTLPSAGFAELSVYNVSGQKIRELVSSDMDPGSHSILWDGNNESGEAVSSGVYISQLTTGNKMIARRMTLMK